MNNSFDVIIVGGGVAGLSVSYHLQKSGISHVVFERGKVGESWRSQRWDSFRLNSLNKLNGISGSDFMPHDPNGFATARDYFTSFEESVRKNKLPVLENSKVVSIEKSGELFNVTVSSKGTTKSYTSKQIVIATGVACEPIIPAFAKNISADIKQLHTCDYRSAAQLPEGAVLVVGSAQSGVQLAEDLADAGRKVYLSTSMVARVPRQYRGRDIMEWLIDMKFFDMRAEDIEDPAMLKMKPPQITGIGGGKYTISLQSLAKKGVTILGKTENASGKNISLHPNATMHVKFADGFSKKVKEMIDGFIAKTERNSPAAEFDENDQPDENASCASDVTNLDLEKNNIRSIIWATGFTGDFSYIKLPLFDESGNLKQKNGIPEFPGVYFVGYPWLIARRSLLLFGIVKDAEFVANKINEALVQKTEKFAV